ncbi:MAG: tetratricopeptide repeat protein [Chitinivibrionales bacterium]|nr:tetratricopeptide repeat protein [Chitinivibrionales bacterium]
MLIVEDLVTLSKSLMNMSLQELIEHVDAEFHNPHSPLSSAVTYLGLLFPSDDLQSLRRKIDDELPHIEGEAVSKDVLIGDYYFQLSEHLSFIWYLNLLNGGETLIPITRMAEIAARCGRQELAFECLELASGFETDPCFVWTVTARCALVQKDLEMASEYLFKTLAEYPDYSCIYLVLGWYYEVQGMRHEAVVAFSKAMELEPSLKHPRLVRGTQWGALGEISRAQKDLLMYYRSCPVRWQAAYNLGIVYYTEGRLLRAVIMFRRASQLCSQSHEPLMMYGFCLEKIGKIRLAITSYLRAYRMTPETIELLFRTGFACGKLGKFRLAEKIFRIILNTDESCALGYYFLAASLDSQGRVSDALPVMDRFLKIESSREFEAEYDKAQRYVELYRDALYGDGKKFDQARLHGEIPTL